MIEDIQYAVFWLANEVHRLPPGRAFLALLGEISDEAIDLAVRCTTAGRQTRRFSPMPWLPNFTVPCSEYRLERTKEERLDSAFLVVSALHMEALRRSGMIEVRSVPAGPRAPDVFSSIDSPVEGGGQARRLNTWRVMKMLLPEAWRCSPAHHNAEAYIDAYLEAAGIAG